ncbi:MAG: sugar ABC transporter ATP-binding protein [Spirochaetes bacterium]|nr:sugar ABC transporter ATP-binding protein [Spirochaetota bacterium]
MPEKLLLEIKGVSKFFPGVRALDNVSFDLRKGEVHALCGENGAGKSTLMKIISGLYKADEGEIIYKGEPVAFNDSKESSSAGISIIYQELNLIPHLTVAQNIFINREPLSGFGIIVDEKKMRQDAVEILDRLNVKINPDAEVRTLPVSKQQMVEIAKALSTKSEILIMDEPTSALTENEIEELFKVISSLKNEGVGIIYISHRLEELKHIVDRISVFRDGQYISTDKFSDVTLPQIVNKMVGRDLKNQFPVRKSKPTGKKIFEVKNLNRPGKIENINFDLYEGEILGFSGLMGAGRTETARAIFGADTDVTGEVILGGKVLNIKNPREAIQNGIAYLPEDRKREGLAVNMLLFENITLANLAEVSKSFGVISRKAENQVSEKYIKDLSIKTSSDSQIVKNLSGGNQQKTVISKWLFKKSNVLIFDEPTRGIDVGAKYEIYKLLDELALNGIGIIIISSELPEILGLTDRVVVMCSGKVANILKTRETTQEQILNYAAGISSNNDN